MHPNDEQAIRDLLIAAARALVGVEYDITRIGELEQAARLAFVCGDDDLGKKIQHLDAARASLSVLSVTLKQAINSVEAHEIAKVAP